jgi:hypothetical protein
VIFIVVGSLTGYWLLTLLWVFITFIIYTVINKNNKNNLSESKINRYFIKKNVEGVLAEGKNKGVIGRHKITLNESGLTETTIVNSEFRTWQGIERIEENDIYIFIYISANSAHIIPKKAFANNNLMKDFIDLANSYHCKALPYININYIDGSYLFSV